MYGSTKALKHILYNINLIINDIDFCRSEKVKLINDILEKYYDTLSTAQYTKAGNRINADIVNVLTKWRYYES